MINVLYANCPICSSPFNVDVFDPFAVQFVGCMPECFVLGKPASFKGDILLGLIAIVFKQYRCVLVYSKAECNLVAVSSGSILSQSVSVAL